MQGPIMFEVTAAQADVADVTGLTVVNLSAAPNLVRVPMYMVVFSPAGDAFTVAGGARMVIRDDLNNVWFSVACPGFLDQTTAQTRVIAASTARAMSAANVSLNLFFTGSVSKGTASPNIKFALWYEQFQLTW